MNAEIVNLYIDKLVNYITELTKTNLLQSAQLSYYEKLNTSLNEKVAELEAALDKVKSRNAKKTTAPDSDF
jgi:hypothetical protein